MTSLRRFLDIIPRTNEFLYFICIICFMLGTHLLNVFLNPDGTIHPDSYSYGLVDEVARNTDSSLRSQIIVFIYSVLQSPQKIVLFQHLVSWFCASVFIYAVPNLVLRSNRNIARVILCLFVMLPPVMSLHSTLLSESISNSLLILMITQIVIVSKKKDRIGYAFLLVLVACWANLKPINTLVFLASLSLLIIGLAFRKVTKKSPTVAQKGLILWSLALASIAFFSAYDLQSKSKADFGGYSYETVSSVVKISNQNPFASDLLKELPSGSLKCNYGTKAINFFENLNRLQTECKQDQNWFSSRFRYWYITTLITHPRVIAGMATQGFLAGTSPISLYSSAISPSPEFFSDLFFGTRNLALRDSNEAFSAESLDGLTLYSPIAIWIIFFIFTCYRRKTFFDFAILQTGCLFSVILISLISPNEWYRQTIQFICAFYLLGILNLISILSLRSSTRIPNRL